MQFAVGQEDQKSQTDQVVNSCKYRAPLHAEHKQGRSRACWVELNVPKLPLKINLRIIHAPSYYLHHSVWHKLKGKYHLLVDIVSRATPALPKPGLAALRPSPGGV